MRIPAGSRDDDEVPDSFDLLGVSQREDSYTCLIEHAFNRDATFRAALLERFDVRGRDGTDWHCRARVSITVGGAKPMRNVPDLIFFSRRAAELVLVEAKIFACEGDERTERYGHEATREELCNRLEVDIPVANQRGIFLTLDGAEPASKWFRAMPWSIVAEAAELSPRTDSLGRLLRELATRIRERDQWSRPHQDVPVLRYLADRPRLVNETIVFARLLEVVAPEFVKTFGATANRGSGTIPLCQWTRPTWSRPGSPAFTIHFELQWDMVVNDLTLYLHHETDPYRSRRELAEEFGESEILRHQEGHQKLAHFLRQHQRALTTVGWDLRSGYLMLARHSFEQPITTEMLHAELGTLIRSMATVVDAAVTEL